jgi:C-terminal peptidase prc
MGSRRKWLLLAPLLAGAFFILIGRGLIPSLASRDDPYEPFKLLSQVVYLVKNDYVEEPDPSRTMQGALKGLVDSLDVLSGYLEPDLFLLFGKRPGPALKETGAVLYKSFGTFPVVIGIKPGSPAETGGLKIGDSISTISGVSTLGMSMLEANLSLLRGEEATIELRLVQAQEDRILEVERRAREDRSFVHTPCEGTLGVWRPHSLQPPAVDELRQDLAARMGGGGTPLVLDLRTCVEGPLDEAIRLVNLFLQKKRVGWLEGRDGARVALSAPEKAPWPRTPLVLWIDQSTMGAAEAAAAILQKHRDAFVIGRKTLGLAARRERFPLEDGSGLILTTAVFRPEGIQEFWLKGIDPDRAIETAYPGTDDYLEATQQAQLKR